MKKGVWAAAGAYFLWGFFPIYWKLLKAIPAAEILLHRVVWSFFFLLLLLGLQKRWQWINILKTAPKKMLIVLGSGVALAINWLIYIWAVNNNFIVEASLGYFINPLVNVALGVVILKERMRPAQWLAIAIAFLGVSYLTYSYGHLPWISLGLAFSFGLYGLMRKTAPLGSLEGLSAEMAFLFLPASGILIYMSMAGSASADSVDSLTYFLLLLTGVATVLPLLLFAYGARRIPLSLVGLLQYIAPTIQFFIGIWIYQEPFSAERLIGFVIIWIALLIYSGESLAHFRRQREKEFV